MNAFEQMLQESGIDPEAEGSVDLLSEKIFGSYAKYLKAYSPSTESLYINVAKNYFEFLAAEEIKSFVNGCVWKIVQYNGLGNSTNERG